ncbi:uncharacterized protein LOC112350721 [Selaginella moellendorffii]|uniref:uncharacterized protein LOC112350721 n=1 Tax=Selaginella moellendorffii TaxID=88036 RepID=UPI000D1CB67B|nr:uncharacterized protein LOC112350721 [Selaginella moellendorffii]|eukprot:XP_024543207.1 uncharacterized protein LOC112350721 [Selaginella moellendorffii]
MDSGLLAMRRLCRLGDTEINGAEPRLAPACARVSGCGDHCVLPPRSRVLRVFRAFHWAQSVAVYRNWVLLDESWHLWCSFFTSDAQESILRTQSYLFAASKYLS